MSDTGRDAIAEGIGGLFGWLTELPDVVLIAVVVGVGVTIVWAGLFRSFPMKKHRWCDGTGHWGIGPFRRKCGACGGSGLVERKTR